MESAERREVRFERLQRQNSAQGNDNDYAIERLTNINNIAEGSMLPPVLRAGSRIVPPSALTVQLQEELEKGTRFVLSWLVPKEMERFKPRYRIYAYYGQNGPVPGFGSNSPTPIQYSPSTSVVMVDNPPADFVLYADTARPVKFELETRLSNGLILTSERRPSCTAFMQPVDTYVKLVDTNYFASVTDRVLLVDATSGALSAYLPNITTIPVGKIYTVKKVDASLNIVTVNPTTFPAQTIDGVGFYNLTSAARCMSFVPLGTNWYSLPKP